MINMGMRNEIQDVRREMYRITGDMNTSSDKKFVAVGNEIAKLKKSWELNKVSIKGLTQFNPFVII